jgi:hypothetical protein
MHIYALTARFHAGGSALGVREGSGIGRERGEGGVKDQQQVGAGSGVGDAGEGGHALGEGAGGTGVSRSEGGGVEERVKEALVDGQVAGPWLTMEGGSVNASSGVYVCSQTAVYVSSYCYVCVVILMLLYVSSY